MGFIVWSNVLLIVPAETVSSADRPTNLEDIEQDFLKNERHLAFKKETITGQQQRATSSQGTNHYTIQIEHHPGGAISQVGHNFVTPIPSAPAAAPAPPPPQPSLQQQPIVPAYSKEYVPQYPQKVPQVHEDHSTYTVPSRQSLIQPTIGGGAPTHHYLNPQPQYVYVQAQPPPQQMHQYSNHPNLAQSLFHILPQNQQAFIMIPSTYYQQQGQQSIPQQPQQPPHSAQQFAAYVNDQNSNSVQSYSHGETGATAPQTFSNPTAPEVTPKPGIIYATPSSTPAPHRIQSPSAEFSIVKSVETPIYFSADNHNHNPTGIHYSHSPAKPAIQIHHETQTTYPSINHPNNGILNYLGVQHKPPTSLLDSYVPSSLQVNHFKPVLQYPTKLAPYYHHTQPAFPVHHHPYQYHHHHHQHQPHSYVQPQPLFYQPSYPVAHQSYPVFPSHAPPTAPQTPIPSPSTYNTIAYSVPMTYTKTLSQYKRSPALETIAGIKFSSPRALLPTPTFTGAITKLHPSSAVSKTIQNTKSP
ncbi:uncharacterized protein LOC129755918 [Uranotaenia lowii]|uniref:uncharacterized protein LOC129755918 n=1 Tax=Uranotaenia lowii TaxID=190385 RepID=UPI0024794CC7|nr:uncharacterized protein LOC129755918 [Uranotaenia lowii]